MLSAWPEFSERTLIGPCGCTAAALSREGSVGVVMVSMWTAPVNQSAGPWSDDLVDGVGAGEAVEHELALVFEPHVAGALRQLLDDGRGEDLPAARLVGDPRGEDDVLAVE